MKISIYDTYIKKNNGVIMHFDILVEESKSLEDALVFGKEYLASKELYNQKITAEECKFCHIETAPVDLEKIVLKNGYHIIEIENC